ncbi:tetratricopeptide repeat protein [Caulobacter segnis]
MDNLQETFDRALAAAAEGRFDAAEAGFRAVLSTRPDDGGVLFSLGVTLMNARRFPEAADVSGQGRRHGRGRAAVADLAWPRRGT